jgi:hypothetical protein
MTAWQRLIDAAVYPFTLNEFDSDWQHCTICGDFGDYPGWIQDCEGIDLRTPKV